MSALSPVPVSRSLGPTCTPAGPSTEQPARRKGCHTYPELVRARRCRLLVVGVQVGGRFGAEAATWLRLLARHRASAAPAATRPAAQLTRWSGLLAVTAQRCWSSLLAGECHVGGETPNLSDLFADDRWQLPIPSNRLGPLGPPKTAWKGKKSFARRATFTQSHEQWCGPASRAPPRTKLNRIKGLSGGPILQW